MGTYCGETHSVIESNWESFEFELWQCIWKQCGAVRALLSYGVYCCV